MRTYIALRGLGCILVVLALSSCKKKTERSPAEADSGGFKASLDMKPRNASLTRDPAQPPAPVLKPTSAIIGQRGGTLASSDGKLRVSVPAGALAGDTEVRIKPGTDEAGGSFGSVYELSPEGTTFAEPISLVWVLSDADLARTNLENLVVRSRESNGRWIVQSNVERNESDHTIRVSAKHFSQWDLAMTLRLQPSAAKVFIGDSLELAAYAGWTELSPPAPDKGETPAPATTARGAARQSQSTSDDDLLATPEDVRHGIFRNAVWRVNGEHCGTLKLGLIKTHHNLSHATDKEGQLDFAKYDLFLSEQISHFLAKMNLKHGVYWRGEGETRMSNIYLSILRSMGLEEQSFSDSRGTISNSIFTRTQGQLRGVS